MMKPRIRAAVLLLLSWPALAQVASHAPTLIPPQPAPAAVTNLQLVCINNLRQIDGAKQQWALENRRPATALPTAQDLLPYFRNIQMPVCPAGGQYSINAVNALPTCSTPGHALPR